MSKSNHDRYERVVFLQGDEADEALAILDEEGEEACLEYLKQWHCLGEHDTCGYMGAGLMDDTFAANGYVLTHNSSLGYVGLEYDLDFLEAQLGATED